MKEQKEQLRKNPDGLGLPGGLFPPVVPIVPKMPTPVELPPEIPKEKPGEYKFDICIKAGFLLDTDILGISVKVPPIDICIPNPIIITADMIWTLMWFILDKLAGEYYAR